MEIKIIQEEELIKCNETDTKACIDCDSICNQEGYNIKFMINDKCIHSYTRYEPLDINDIEELEKLISKIKKEGN